MRTKGKRWQCRSTLTRCYQVVASMNVPHSDGVGELSMCRVFPHRWGWIKLNVYLRH